MYNTVFLTLLTFNVVYSSNLEYDGWATLTLQHALEDVANPVYTDRGNISILSLRTGSHNINQEPLSPSDITKIKELSASNKFYQLKSTVLAADGTVTIFYSSVKACMLAESELNDILSVSLDYVGRIIAVTLAVASTTTCEGAVVPSSNLKEFRTTVFVRYTDIGPSPDTASYIQKLEREREAKEKGELKDNRSFLAKYWMYILPVVIIMVLSSATNPDAAAGGGGNGGGR
ncbi:ER membrane protein complex subunit 10 [Agrilus planipennis]|uniref:ER membrane protein complex subunit 10 n=1 Tax=Agrilus planipennis TaxID=224129 RepID=A0A1W4WHV2_AGRPL|nr:ER membrane protein complex subunit 10 [Agrilus planipennis]XP_018320037.1 ER membrane protein complex subunit 10 [Agrilus planipennis]XP_025829333.1 ER membrane protein complex subunit 10 [Agrilus planipennis]